MCLFLTRGALCADAPVAKVPHASIPALLDGRVDEAEWRERHANVDHRFLM
jgi:hypothetical protein